jgi:hypothetical protein
MRRSWTLGEERHLIALTNNGLTAAEAATVLGRTLVSVEYKRRDLYRTGRLARRLHRTGICPVCQTEPKLWLASGRLAQYCRTCRLVRNRQYRARKRGVSVFDINLRISHRDCDHPANERWACLRQYRAQWTDESPTDRMPYVDHSRCDHAPTGRAQRRCRAQRERVWRAEQAEQALRAARAELAGLAQEAG